MRLHVCVKEEK